MTNKQQSALAIVLVMFFAAIHLVFVLGIYTVLTTPFEIIIVSIALQIYFAVRLVSAEVYKHNPDGIASYASRSGAIAELCLLAVNIIPIWHLAKAIWWS